MQSADTSRPRRATVADAERVAALLHDFNAEFEVATPGVAVLTERLRVLLTGDDTVAFVAGTPPVAVALFTLRPNVWNDGPVALLDELYVRPDRRGEGIGAELLRTAVDDLAGHGVELVEINVDEGDVDAQRFYRRHGFTEVDPDTDERAFYLYRELDPSAPEVQDPVSKGSAPDSFVGVFESLPRQGPGGRAHTARALAACAGLPAAPDVVDLGSGSGAQSLDLAELTSGHVVAVDLHAPFARILRDRAADRGLATKVAAITADMAAPGLTGACADLVWSEGALYNIGLPAALTLARELLRPGGFLGFTEAVWRREDPSAAAREAFADYPAMGSVDDVLALLARRGFDLVDHFPLPRAAWWDEFYVPMGRRVAELRTDPDADRGVLDRFDAEIDLFVHHGDSFGYEFFVARSTPSEGRA